MVQLWVNLPAKDKMRPAAYQGITADQIPTVAIDGGKARIIAGELDGAKGPAHTFSPINLWDLRLESDTDIGLALPEGHNAMIAVLTGHITVDGEGVGAAEVARFSVNGAGATIHTDGEAMLLVIDRKSVVSGTRGSGRVDIGGRGIIT